MRFEILVSSELSYGYDLGNSSNQNQLNNNMSATVNIAKKKGQIIDNRQVFLISNHMQWLSYTVTTILMAPHMKACYYRNLKSKSQFTIVDLSVVLTNDMQI